MSNVHTGVQAPRGRGHRKHNTASVRTGEQPTRGEGQRTPTTPRVHTGQSAPEAKDTAQTTHQARTQCTVAKRPRTVHNQHDTPSTRTGAQVPRGQEPRTRNTISVGIDEQAPRGQRHGTHSIPSVSIGEQAPKGQGLRVHNTTHQARTPVNKRQAAEKTANTRLLSLDELQLAMNAHLPVIRPLLCYARQGATPMHQKKTANTTLQASAPVKKRRQDKDTAYTTHQAFALVNKYQEAKDTTHTPRKAYTGENAPRGQGHCRNKTPSVHSGERAPRV